MKLEISELILLLAGFLAGMVTFEFCCRAYRIYSDRRQAREAREARHDWCEKVRRQHRETNTDRPDS